ncbi:MAG: heme-binding protein [Mariniblastus sp.]|nr:heme-binding protein [Mariniblastus sp.]
MKITYLAGLLIVIGGAYLVWKSSFRNAYESAAYSQVKADGQFEIRDYPDLQLVTTSTNMDAAGNDGSFMRLFRYISGGNETKQKVAMTTPVFMDSSPDDTQEQMGFVLPKKVAEEGAPEPTGQGVELQVRPGGQFAVLRFAGRMGTRQRSDAEEKLRSWIEQQDLSGEGQAEFAGYDPPWIPGFLRRNEVLIRLD